MQGPRRDLEATLIELELQQFLPRLLELGVSSLSDVAHLFVADFEEVGLTRLQTRKLQQAASAALGAPEASNAAAPQEGIPAERNPPRLSVVVPGGKAHPTQPQPKQPHQALQPQPSQPQSQPQQQATTPSVEQRAPIIRSPPVVLQTQALSVQSGLKKQATALDEKRKSTTKPNGSLIGPAGATHKAAGPPASRGPIPTPQVPHLGAVSVLTATAAAPAVVSERVVRSVRGSYGGGSASPPMPMRATGAVPVVPELAFPPADPIIDAALDASAERGAESVRQRIEASTTAGVVRRETYDEDHLFFDATEDAGLEGARLPQTEAQACVVRTACPATRGGGGASAAASTAAPSSSDRSGCGRNAARASIGQPVTSNESESGSDIYEEVDIGSDEQANFDIKDPRNYFRLDIGASPLEDSPSSLAGPPGVGQQMPVALRRRLEHRNEQRRRGQQQTAQKAPMSARGVSQQQQQQQQQASSPTPVAVAAATPSESNSGVRLRPGEEEPSATPAAPPAWMNFDRLPLDQSLNANTDSKRPSVAAAPVGASASKAATPAQQVKSPRKGHGGPAAGKQQRSRPAPEGVGPLNLPARVAASPQVVSDANRTSSAGARAGPLPGDRTPPPVAARMTRSDSGSLQTLNATAKAIPQRSETPRLSTAEPSSEGGRQMFDKNTLRAMHRDLFKAAVQNYRHDVLRISKERDDPNNQGGMPSGSHGSRAPVTVYARIRPLFPKDEQVGDFDVATVVPSSKGELLPSKMMLHNCLFEADLKTPYINHLQFEFDQVFGPAATNHHVYGVTAADLVQGACSGGVGTIFMFGQTGSGKTHTMTAIEELAAHDIFAALPIPRPGDEEPHVAVQFVELRGNRCYDLIARDAKAFPELRLREHTGGVYTAEGAVELFPRSPEDLLVVMRTAHSRRATSATSANDVSSRSHAICIIHLLRSGGQLVLVDCAGTERRKDSMYHSKERQQEGAEINASLHALKECIRHMSLHQRVPSHAYRASALTKILAEAFSHAGQAKLIVICTASPCASDTEHTLTTLRMGMALGGRGQEHEEKDMLKELLHQQKAPRVAHPKQWTPEQVRSWLAELQNGQFRDALEALPSNTTGRMLVRLTVTRCAQLCGGSTRRGQQLFELLHQEMERAEESRNSR
mmetsp:Transcript_11463/g.26524  ORF Transcript_11463/g.26524 Transcript_11463/m.26524 type:complete len:1149 (-) Transcript_11463:73-3519(-)